MGTTTISLPNTLTNGETADADEVMANFNAIVTAVVTTGLQVGNLQEPNHMVCVRMNFGDINGGSSEVRRWKLPSSIGATAVEAQLSFQSDGGGNPTVSLQATWNGGNLLASALTSTTPASTATSSSFATSTATGGDELVATVTETVGGGNHAHDVQVTLWIKMEHQS
jgi:hypothetical protein